LFGKNLSNDTLIQISIVISVISLITVGILFILENEIEDDENTLKNTINVIKIEFLFIEIFSFFSTLFFILIHH
jgi:hypothetical protein